MTSDPTKLPVQLNLQVPWDFREFLRRKSAATNVSQNKLACDALMDKFGDEFKAEMKATRAALRVPQ